MQDYIVVAIGACLFGLILITLRRSGALKKIALSTLGGLAALGAVNLSGMMTGISLALNLWTFATAVILGLPGVVGMLFLKLMWHI